MTTIGLTILVLLATVIYFLSLANNPLLAVIHELLVLIVGFKETISNTVAILLIIECVVIIAIDLIIRKGRKKE